MRPRKPLGSALSYCVIGGTIGFLMGLPEYAHHWEPVFHIVRISLMRPLIPVTRVMRLY